MSAALLLALYGCGGPETAPEPEAGPDLGWIETVARDPSAFGALMEQTGRSGWIELHGHDNARATATFAQDPGLRARSGLGVMLLERDLAELSTDAHRTLFERWKARGELPPGGAAIAAWSSWCSGAEASAWLAMVPDSDPGAEIAALIETPADQWPNPVSPAARRLAAHRQALTTDLMAPWDQPEVPVLTTVGTIHRTWYDPCFHRVSSAHATRVVAPDGWDAVAESWSTAGLAGDLFAPWLSTEDLAADLAAHTLPQAWGLRSAQSHGLTDRAPAVEDDAQRARELAREVAERLTTASDALNEAAPDDGKALLVELQLAEHWRQQWHLAAARAALDASRPRQALALAELGTDFASPPGPENPPGLYAVRARALLLLGRTREALDALHALDDHRGVRQLAEILGDLAVLEGLDRSGDSKEN